MSVRLTLDCHDGHPTAGVRHALIPCPEFAVPGHAASAEMGLLHRSCAWPFPNALAATSALVGRPRLRLGVTPFGSRRFFLRGLAGGILSPAAVKRACSNIDFRCMRAINSL